MAKAAAERAAMAAAWAGATARDGRCRLAWLVYADTTARQLLGLCDGPSQLAHLDGHRRHETRNQAPADRHDVRHTVKLCWGHHLRDRPPSYDRHGFDFEYLTNRAANGPLRVRVQGHQFDEQG